MEGIFWSWSKAKPEYGSIKCDDGTDLFVHQKSVSDPLHLRRGTRLVFEVEEREGGRRKAVNVVRVDADPVPIARSEERLQGAVKLWNEQGWGFIDCAQTASDIYVRAAWFTPGQSMDLAPGDVVEFQVADGERGLQACNVIRVGWQPPKDHLHAFADLGGAAWLDPLVELAEDEPWEYRRSNSSEPLPVLRSYLHHTFRRLEELGGIAITEDGSAAAFNTGLVTPNQEDIYGHFAPNPKPGRQPWLLLGFKKASHWDIIEKFGSTLPPLATYFTDPSVLLYDRRCELYINIDHVMEHIERFPPELQNNPYVARQLLASAEMTTKKRVYRNYKTAIPQFFRPTGGAGSVQLLLPVCLQNPAQADLALVVDRNESATAYRCSTVLTLDMAYNNARLLARPDTEWLQP